TRQPSSYEECMVYIQSSYNAANILYLYQKYKMAFEIINNGLKYFESNTELCTSKQIRNAKMWSILLISLSFDIMKYMKNISDSQKLETKNKILSGIKEYNEANDGSFPILAIIFVRKLFLEMETSNDMCKELRNWLLPNQLDMSMENDDLYKKYITTYKSFLIFFHNSDLNNTFNNIFKAIEKPVLNIEDRLLNYFAIESTLTEVNKYIQEHDTDEFIMDKFSIFEDYVKNNNDLFDLRLTTIPKLRILYDRSNTNFIKMLYEDLKMKNKIINENILYLILSSMLNMNTQPKQLYNDNKRNVEIG
ncbi:uncharacterized protein LOC112599963, partial [Melanaphis sacchari]|uniref:uncharacterized protein LOC112599963 n=1 Tax=Melanaphis sacchari TaxID=742174 RepID=UPI000DC13340